MFISSYFKYSSMKAAKTSTFYSYIMKVLEFEFKMGNLLVLWVQFVGTFKINYVKGAETPSVYS